MELWLQVKRDIKSYWTGGEPSPIPGGEVTEVVPQWGGPCGGRDPEAPTDACSEVWSDKVTNITLIIKMKELNKCFCFIKVKAKTFNWLLIWLLDSCEQTHTDQKYQSTLNSFTLIYL